MAAALAEKLGAQIEELKDTVDRSGTGGYFLSGRDAATRRLTKLAPAKFNPADFDLVIVGTPIWAWNLSAPVRTYLTEQKNNFKKVVFFCTMGGSGDERAAQEAEQIIGQKFSAHLALTTREVVKNEFAEKVDKFISDIK